MFPNKPATVFCRVILLLLLSSPADAANDVANLMRGMFTGLALLGQASNSPGLGTAYPGLWGSPLGMSPWGSPLGGVPMGYPGTFPGSLPPGMYNPALGMGTSPWNTQNWNTQNWNTPGWAPATPQGIPGQPTQSLQPGLQRGNPYAYLMRLLQGSWETHTGGLLLVKGNLARLYVSRDEYQDLEITADQHYVWMRPAGTRQPPDRYEHRIFDRRVVLRDDQERVLILRRHETAK